SGTGECNASGALEYQFRHRAPLSFASSSTWPDSCPVPPLFASYATFCGPPPAGNGQSKIPAPVFSCQISVFRPPLSDFLRHSRLLAPISQPFCAPNPFRFRDNTVPEADTFYLTRPTLN